MTSQKIGWNSKKSDSRNTTTGKATGTKTTPASQGTGQSAEQKLAMTKERKRRITALKEMGRE